MTPITKTLALIMLLIVTGILRSQAQLASFSFSKTPETGVIGWTNVYGDPYTGIRSGTANGITVSSVSTGNWAPNSVPSSAYDFLGASPSVYFPTVIMGSTWLQYNGTSYNLALYNHGSPQLKLSGLNKDSTYTIRMSGSDVFFTGSTQYTVEGFHVSSPQYLDTYNNTTQGVTFQHIAPDSNGVIKIYVNGVVNSSFAVICGLQIFSGSANVGTPTISIASPANGVVISEGANLSINTSASETGGTITKVEFYADTTKIGEVDAAPYNFTWVDPAPGKYLITAKATDNVGTINTAAVNIGVESLNYFWSTTGNIATGADSSFVGTVDTNRLAFRTNNIERMSILGDGTIGIGTKNTYGYALAVNGNAIVTKLRIKAAGAWPDYVFKKDYSLEDLDSLERYIDLHQHLPGITPATDINRDGLDISSQESAMLKKVEELTLYLIRENKILKEQNQRLSEQEKGLKDLQIQLDTLKKLMEKK